MGWAEIVAKMAFKSLRFFGLGGENAKNSQN